jgi:hypothetical protein
MYTGTRKEAPCKRGEKGNEESREKSRQKGKEAWQGPSQQQRE